MASLPRTSAPALLPSDPEFLLEFIDHLPADADSDEEFDDYLGPDDGPVAFSRETCEERPTSVASYPLQLN